MSAEKLLSEDDAILLVMTELDCSEAEARKFINESFDTNKKIARYLGPYKKGQQ